MEHVYLDGLTDFYSSQHHKMDYGGPTGDSSTVPQRYRVKMKQGVSTLDLTSFASVIWGVDRGLGDGVSRDLTSGLACGEYVTFFMWANGASFRYQYSASGEDLGVWLSQFERVYDPLPEWFGMSARRTVTIDSPDFVTDQGLFDSAEWCDRRLKFTGSTFKVAPKLFTDRLMGEFQFFPANATSTSIPFYPFENCPDLERIEFQGEFSPILDVLYPCNFSYTDDEGFDRLDGYPEGGNPLFVLRYVNANKVHASERFPMIGTERLQYAIEPFDIAEVSIDAASALSGWSLPFGGMDYRDAEMEALHIKNPVFTIDLPMQSPEELGFSFSWGTLGIVAPASCRDVANLHMIWQNVTPYPIPTAGPATTISNPVNIADPEYLKQNVVFSWGNALESFIDEDPSLLTSEFMPRVPSGLERVENYYTKIILGLEEEFDDYPSVYSLDAPLLMGGVPHSWNIDPLPEGVRFVNGYCVNLYAHNQIGSAIFIPKVPSTLELHRDLLRRTFYNSLGPKVPITPEGQEPVLLLIWTKTNSTTSHPIYVVANAAESSTNGFKTIYDASVTYNGAPPQTHKINAWSRSGDIIDSTVYGSYDSMMDDLSEPGEHTVVTRIITSPIVIEKQPALANIQMGGGMQKECFFGASIDPTMVDTLLTIPESQEWENYTRALVLGLGKIYGAGDYYYRGQFFSEKESSSGTERLVQYYILYSYAKFDPEQFEDYVFDINDIIMSGSPRTQGTNVIDPYRELVSTSTITGNFDTFVDDNSINVVSPDFLMTSAGEGVLKYYLIGGTTFGFNARRFYRPEEPQHQRRGYYITVSYEPPSSIRFKPSSIQQIDPIEEPDVEPYYFNTPFIVDSFAVSKVWGAEYSMNSQTQLNNAVSLINSFLDV